LDYGEAYKICGLVGITARLVDKAMRLKSLTIDKREAMVAESLRETLMDTVCLAANGILIIDENNNSK
jgi:hypothetical protein